MGGTYGKKEKGQLMAYYFANAKHQDDNFWHLCMDSVSCKFKVKYYKHMSKFSDFKFKSNGYQLLTQNHGLSKLG